MKQLRNIIFILTFLIMIVVISYFIMNLKVVTNPIIQKNNKIVTLENESELFKKGKEIFITDCNVCHVQNERLHNFLNGIFEKIDTSYFKIYITKQDSLLNTKDTYALERKENFEDNGFIHSFKYNNEEIKALIEYLK